MKGQKNQDQEIIHERTGKRKMKKVSSERIEDIIWTMLMTVAFGGMMGYAILGIFGFFG